MTGLDLSNFPKIRNREESRAFKKVLLKSGKTEDEATQIIDLAKKATLMWETEGKTRSREFLLEGEQVKLNVDKMWNYPDWESRQEAYKQFVQDSIDIIFTVKYAEGYQDKPGIVELKKDGMVSMWRFADNDLLVLDKNDGVFKELWLIEENIGGQNE
ncbi:MAG: hypothetical protein LBD23_18550 [Oscillospiraceae bacterium]|jgi:hypothetical protein|nr:hypothetical protein [Oscillospiraceae bacterium]